MASKYGEPHIDMLRAYSSSKASGKRTRAAVEHVNNCMACLGFMVTICEGIDKAGIKADQGRRSPAELAASFRRRAEELLRREQEKQQEDEHSRWLRLFLRNPHGSAENVEARKHIDTCDVCKDRLELGDEMIARVLGIPPRRAPRQQEEKE